MQKRKISPYLIIILCFLAPILVGATLLCLPFATVENVHISFVDALFTATSAVSTTGLSVLDVGKDLTVFGQIVVIVMMEIGGLSLLTFACFFILFVQERLDYSTQSLMKEALNRDTMSDMKNIVRKIVAFSFSVQLIGAIVDLIVFLMYFDDVGFSFRAAIFHAVSSYNNAGIDIFGTGDSLITLTAEMPVALNVVFKINTVFMVLIGGVSFIFIEDIWKKRSWKRLALSTKIVLIMSLSLAFGGGTIIEFFMLAAGKNTSFLECLFIACSAAGAGFDNLGMNNVPVSVFALLILLMYVGASPGSTGGGIKTTAVFVVCASVTAFIRGKEPSFGYKRISAQSVNKSFVLVVCSIFYILLTVVILCAVEGDRFSFEQILFETVSAFSTTGLSTGITGSVNTASKLILSLTMFVGRVGVLTFINGMGKNWIFSKTKKNVKYIEENIIIG